MEEEEEEEEEVARFKMYTEMFRFVHTSWSLKIREAFAECSTLLLDQRSMHVFKSCSKLL
jgi:hypothetical protein